MEPGQRAESRFKFAKRPEFASEVAYGMLAGNRKGDGGMFTYRTLIAASALVVVCFLCVLLVIWSG
jgi:hypothetical protein